jgi:guanine deaminase
MNKFLQAAFDEALKGMDCNHGGPFGAVVVKDGKIIATGCNEVLKTNDPTAHAEVVAIRKASTKLNRFDLSDCEIYSTSEPCPMCFSAVHWAKIKKLYYGCTRTDAADAGFDDEFIYDVIKGTTLRIQVEVKQLNREECVKLFEKWVEKEDKRLY